MLLGSSPLGYRTLRAAWEPATVAVIGITQRDPEGSKGVQRSPEACSAALTAISAASRLSSPSRSAIVPSDLRSADIAGLSPRPETLLRPVVTPWVGVPCPT